MNSRIRTTPMDSTRLTWLRERNEEYLRDPRVHPRLVELRDRLLDLGGQGVALCFEEDTDKILDRGRVRPGRGAILMVGDANSCHANSANLYDQNRGRAEIETGWALSKDGCWRQHTWVFDTKKNKVVETTVKRVLYYGFTMTEQEADRFVEENYL